MAMDLDWFDVLNKRRNFLLDMKHHGDRDLTPDEQKELSRLQVVAGMVAGWLTPRSSRSSTTWIATIRQGRLVEARQV